MPAFGIHHRTTLAARGDNTGQTVGDGGAEGSFKSGRFAEGHFEDGRARLTFGSKPTITSAVRGNAARQGRSHCVSREEAPWQ